MSKEHETDESDEGKDDKPVPRRNKLKRKKQETNGTKVSQKPGEEDDCKIMEKVGEDHEKQSEKLAVTGHMNGKSYKGVEDDVAPNPQNGCVSHQEEVTSERSDRAGTKQEKTTPTKGCGSPRESTTAEGEECSGSKGTKQEKTTPTKGCGSPRESTTAEGEECSGSKGTQGETMNLEWNKRIDIEKCRTPTDKSKDKSCKKKNKLRKRKKETDSRETVNKSLNLSDICTNMADVSIISDGGMNTSRVLNVEEDAENNKTGDDGGVEDMGVTEISYEVFLGKAADSKERREGGNSGETEESYEDFLSKQKSDETDAIHEQKVEGKSRDKLKQGTSQDVQKDQPVTKSVDNNEKPVKKKRGKLRKEANNTDAIKDNDEPSDDKLEEAENVKEVSYLDYLSTIRPAEKEGSTEKVTSSSQSSSQLVEAVPQPSEEDGTDIPMPKQYPSITNFFSRLGKGEKCTNISKAKQTVSYIKAIIHELPGEKSENQKKSLDKAVEKKTSVRNHRHDRRGSLREPPSDEIIEVLSSEIIVVDEPVHVKCGNGTKNTGKNEREMEELDPINGKCGKSQKSTGKIESKTEALNPESKAGMVETEQNAEKEKRKLFLHSVDTEDKPVIQKKSQATLSFTKGGLQMNKAVKESTETVPEKASESTPEPEKKKRGRPKGKKDKGETTQDSTSSPNSNRVFEESMMECKGDKSTPSLLERRKSLRQKYKVKLLQNQGGQSPIRMKFTR